MTDDDDLAMVKRCLLRCTEDESVGLLDEWLAMLRVDTDVESRAVATFHAANRALLDPNKSDRVADAWLAMHRELGIRHVVAENAARLTFDAERWANRSG